MKILFLSAEYPPETSWGGIATYVGTLAPAVARLGHEVHVLSCVSGQATTETLVDGVQVHRRPTLRIGLSKIRLPEDLRRRVETALSNAVAIQRLGDFDVVEAPDWMAESAVIAFRRRMPLVVHMHGPLRVLALRDGGGEGPSTKAASSLEMIAAIRADVVTVPSRAMVRELSSTPLRRRELKVVPPPVDIDRWHPASSPAEKPTVVAVGRVQPIKRPNLLIEAVSLLCSEVENVSVIFVGRVMDRAYGSELLAAAHRLGVDCRLVGHVGARELEKWYHLARVVAVVSEFESFSMTGAEAMACGRPVVCTANVGLAEFGDPTICPVVVGDSAGEVAAGIKPLVAAAELAHAVGLEARRIAHREFAPHRAAVARAQLYDSAVKAWSRPHKC